RFQPGNIGRDLKQMLEHRQRAADDRGGHNSISNRERALDADHSPIVAGRWKQSDRSDGTERERQQPNGQTDANAGTDEFAAPPHLKREINGCESADQTRDEKWRVNSSKQHAAPKA